jgi:hypothetical protein
VRIPFRRHEPTVGLNIGSSLKGVAHSRLKYQIPFERGGFIIGVDIGFLLEGVSL